MLTLTKLEDLTRRIFHKLPCSTGVKPGKLKGQEGFFVMCWGTKNDTDFEGQRFFSRESSLKYAKPHLDEMAKGWKDFYASA